jgi:hypothetical protein
MHCRTVSFLIKHQTPSFVLVLQLMKRNRSFNDNPKRKKSSAIVEAPIPGTSAAFRSGQLQQRYQGTFVEFGVWIKDPIQAMDLFDSGFYGKGGEMMSGGQGRNDSR